MKKYLIPIILFAVSFVLMFISVKFCGLDFSDIVFFDKASTLLVLAVFTFTMALLAIWIIKIRDYYN